MTAVVIDNGSRFCKAGLAGKETPSSVFPTIVGQVRPNIKELIPRNLQKDYYVGSEALAKRTMLSLKYPIQDNLIYDWEGMEKIWQESVYDQLNVNSEEHPVLLTEPPRNPKGQREKMTEVMFEKFHVPSLFMSTAASLALRSAGVTTGLVLDSGNTVSYSVPVYESHHLPYGINCLFIGGQNLTSHLMHLITENGYSFTNNDTYQNVNDIKEKTCFVASDYQKESGMESDSLQYKMIDGETLTITKERFQCAEVMFKPLLLGIEMPGIHEMIHNSIMKCDPTLHKDLFANILLSGGNTMFKGMAARLQTEMMALVPATCKVNVTATANGNHAAWVGGSILASSEMFPKMWISSEEYDETGPMLVHRKCF